MRILLDTLCAKRTGTKANANLDSNVSKKKSADPELWRDVLAYWILGLCTEFGYVVMICAANDILHGFDHNPSIERRATADDATIVRQKVCDTQSTGVLLIADILPSMLMNISCPFLPLVKNFRMLLVIVLNATSFLLIASTEAEYLAIVGIVCTSMALGIGEVTLLSYSAQFNKKVITAWSSGTGSAGIIGSLSWAGLIALGISPRDVMRLMLIIPVIQAASFWILLRTPEKQVSNKEVKTVDIATIEANNISPEYVEATLEVKLSGLKAKLKFVPKLASFIIPLVFVFIFEYICVSGLFEMIYVRDFPFGIKIEAESQYRWLLVTYQIGLFTSRSLGAFVSPRRTWWASIAQFCNFCFFLYAVATSNGSNSWIIFLFVFELGVIGGLCFVHTFHRLVKELPANQHKFSLGMVTIAESFGIAMGGVTAILIHNILCGKFLVSN